MSINNYPDVFLNMPAFNALRRTQEQFNNSAFAVTMRELQKTINAIKVPTLGITTAIQTYQDSIAPLTTAVQNINNLYTPILEQTRTFEYVYNKSLMTALQTSIPVMKVMADFDLSAIQSIVNTFPKYEFLSENILKNIDFSSVAEMYDNGTITDEEIAEEFTEIIAKKDFSIAESWDNIKKSKWFLAIRWLLIILTFLGGPVIDKAKDNTLDALKVNDFWEESGIYEWLDEVFGIEKDGDAINETDAKSSVDESKTGNISKQKREDLLNKIKAIRAFISAAPQDENTGNLLSYLSDLEKDVNGKKYGLVFEEHREEIDEVLDTHTPVLSEEKNLFIDNGGQMNFLIEGDNLTSLKLLEKTHKGKIDLIYIDPPYNTGSPDFKYNDTIVAKEDSFRHSKWISFMKCRLQIAHELLSDNGIIFISIDENEQAPLKLLCDEIFSPENHIETIIWKNKYGAGAKTVGFISVHEYILCYSKKPISDITSELDKEGQAAYKKTDEKSEVRGGYLTQPLMTKSLADRPNLVYDIEYNGDIIHPRKQWVWSKERLETAIKNNEVEFNKQKDGSYSVRAKKYLFDENGNIRRGKPLSILSGPFTQDGTQEIRKIFGTEDAFKFSKPSELIKYFIAFEINGISSKNAVILDFFAGSGTTAQAVLAQNKKDNGNRRFILCTNNESNICRDVTYNASNV